MSEPRREAALSKVISLPRTRRLAWASVALEFTHQIVVATWVGGLAALGFLAAPALLSSLDNAVDAARASLELLLRLSFLGAGAGAFCLLTTLLMHLLALRTTRTTLIQTGVLLAMTVAAVLVYVAVAPPMQDLLQAMPDLFTGEASAERERYEFLHRLAVGLVGCQVALGAALLLLGVRRWYRYVPVNRHLRPEL